MDISKEYIEMCKKAVEIQQLYKNKHDRADKGCFVYINRIKSVEVIPHTFAHQKSEDIWLPRQDQLQEIYWADKLIWHVKQIYFEGFLKQNCLTADSDSFEQAWLKFVMEGKFKKKWNKITKNWEEIKYKNEHDNQRQAD